MKKIWYAVIMVLICPVIKSSDLKDRCLFVFGQNKNKEIIKAEQLADSGKIITFLDKDDQLIYSFPLQGLLDHNLVGKSLTIIVPASAHEVLFESKTKEKFIISKKLYTPIICQCD